MTADGQIAGGHTCVSALICSERGGNPGLDSEVCPGLQKISGSYATAGGRAPYGQRRGCLARPAATRSAGTPEGRLRDC